MNRFDYIRNETRLPECFSKKIMREKIFFSGQNIEFGNWIDTMPSKYRDVAYAAVKQVGNKYIGSKMVVKLMSDIINDLYETITNDPRMKGGTT